MCCLAMCGLFALVCLIAGQAEAQYTQTNLVSDIPGLATITDPTLLNPWGISHTATNPLLDF